MKNKYFYGLSLLALASCTVGPDYQQPQFYSDEQIVSQLRLKGKADNSLNRNWYRSFNDSTLNNLIMRGLKAAPDAKIAVARLRQARLALKSAQVQSLPMINADGSYHYTKLGDNSGYPFSVDYFQTGLDATWELDIWGANRRRTESLAALYKAAAANLDAVKLSLTAEIASDYISLRTSQEQLQTAEQNLQLQQNIYKLVNSKYQSGLADEAALKQAQYAVESTKAAIPQFKTAIESYQNALAVLLGQLPGSLNQELASSDSNLLRRPFSYNLQNIFTIPLQSVRLRPDVSISEAYLISQNAEVGYAIAQLYPNISLSGFLGFQASKVPDLLNRNSFTYSYSPVINLPVFHWGELTNNVELQKSIAEAYLYQYQDILLQAASDIKNSYTEVINNHDRYLASKKAVIAQKRVLDLTLERYKQGLVDFNNVLVAEQNLLSSQNSFVISNGDIYQGLILFYKSVGGGYLQSDVETTSHVEQPAYANSSARSKSKSCRL